MGSTGPARRVRLVLAAVVVVATACGCGAPRERIDGASAVASSFAEAARSGDGTAMCALLARGTREELARSEGTTCDKAVVEQRLSTVGPVREVDVHGLRAMARFEGDTLFLSRFSTGWKVVAAGCVPRPGQPYRCRVKGG